MILDRLAGLQTEIGFFLAVHMHPSAMQPFQVHVRKDIFLGTAAQPEISDMIRVVDRIRLYVCSDGNDKGAVLDLERKVYAELFSDHFMAGAGSPGIFTRLKIQLHDLFESLGLLICF
jgi:hypothetical protein